MALNPHPPLLSSFFWLLHFFPLFLLFFLLFCPYWIHYFLSVFKILKLRFSSFHFPPSCYCSTCILSLFHPCTCTHMELKTNLLRDQLQNYIHLPNIVQVTSMPQQHISEWAKAPWGCALDCFQQILWVSWVAVQGLCGLGCGAGWLYTTIFRWLCQRNIYMNARAQGFPAKHFIDPCYLLDLPVVWMMCLIGVSAVH